MTVAEAQKLYSRVFPNSVEYQSEWTEIRKEMQAVIDAPTEDAAAEVIFWWGCWNGKSERKERADCKRYVKRLRQCWAKMNGAA